MHWVSKDDSFKATVRLYDRLFKTAKPGSGEKLEDDINPDSLTVLDNCLIEGGLKDAKVGDVFQFMRQGYFCVDKDSTPGNMIINRTVDLKSSWGK